MTNAQLHDEIEIELAFLHQTVVDVEGLLALAVPKRRGDVLR